MSAPSAADGEPPTPPPESTVAAATVPSAMNDEEIDELILNRLRQRRGQDSGDRTLSAADLATFFNEPEPRIQDRLKALAEQGQLRESAAAPDRWMIVLDSDPDND